MGQGAGLIGSSVTNLEWEHYCQSISQIRKPRHRARLEEAKLPSVIVLPWLSRPSACSVLSLLSLMEVTREGLPAVEIGQMSRQ